MPRERRRKLKKVQWKLCRLLRLLHLSQINNNLFIGGSSSSLDNLQQEYARKWHTCEWQPKLSTTSNRQAKNVCLSSRQERACNQQYRCGQRTDVVSGWSEQSATHIRNPIKKVIEIYVLKHKDRQQSPRNLQGFFHLRII